MSKIIFGIHAVQSLLAKRPQQVVQLLLVGRDDLRMQEILALAKSANIAVQEMSRQDLNQQYPQDNHQGVVALVKASRTQAGESGLLTLLDQLDAPPFLLVLDGVQDPHNLGACLRTAEAAGVDAVVVPKDKAVGLTATVSKVACGAAERVPFFAVTNLARVLGQLQQRGIWVYGAAGEAHSSLYKMDFSGALAVVLGAEGKGLRRLTREHCDQLFAIPMLGDADSLNVSVAAGVCLYEVVRQKCSGNQ